MSIHDLKSRLHDIEGIQNLSMALSRGNIVLKWGTGYAATVGAAASDNEIERAVRNAALLPPISALTAELRPASSSAPAVNDTYILTPDQLLTPNRSSSMSTPLPPLTPSPAPAAKGGFAASLKAMLDEAKAGIAQAQADGTAKVKDAVSKLNAAQTATTHVATNLASTIESQAADVMAELGQISNDLGL